MNFYLNPPPPIVHIKYISPCLKFLLHARILGIFNLLLKKLYFANYYRKLKKKILKRIPVYFLKHK